MLRELATRSNLTLDVRLFGGVEAFCAGEAVALGGERERKVFVALAAQAPTPISRDQLPEWIWDEVPDRAPDELHKIMTRLRNNLGTVGLRDVLVSKHTLCWLGIPADAVDVHRFATLAAKADHEDDDARRAALMRQALELSHDLPLADLHGRRVDGYRAQLVERRREVEITLAELDVRQGRYRLADLILMFQERPGDSKVAAVTIAAFHLAGRQPEALNVFDSHRAQLIEQGLDVPSELRDLQLRVLSNEGMRLPTDLLDAAHVAPPGGAMPATEKNNDHSEAECDDKPMIGGPAIGQIIQHGRYVNNFGHVNAPGGHFGPRFDSRHEDDDDD